ncbi:hypothetical protein ElyMa_002504200 [Elysia marginata]|uniref:Uncharacterized protein n=1 Tax=Elysia marginata TaxID=1093978 RepID=A0AAV4GRG4_9GAST|nr:hypothetical protein ElyMa_002504200 [Elysia marginata]
MPEFTKENPTYTQMTSIHGRSVLRVGQAFKADKMEFWNSKVPKLYLDQLRQEIHLLDLRPLHPALSHRGDHSDILIRGSSSGDHVTRVVPPVCGSGNPQHPQPYISGHWVLITACVGLSGLVLLLSICYCQVRRQVNRLMRQSSLSSGQTIL